MLSFLISIAIIVIIYSLLTLAMNIRWGFTGMLDFGIVGFFAIGAYTDAILTTPPSEASVFGEVSVIGYGVPIWGGFLAAIVVSAVLAFIIGIPSLRLRGDYLAITTIGLAEVIRFILVNERWLTRGVQGIRNIPQPFSESFPANHKMLYFFALILIVGVFYFIAYRLRISPLGRVFRGIREDEVVTASLGKWIFSNQMLAFVIGAAIAGAAGSLWAHFAGSIQPNDFQSDVTFLIWVCLIIGGSGNNLGSFLGTVLVIGLFQQATRFLPAIPGHPQWIPAIRLMLVGLLLVITLRVRPQGLFPEKALNVERLIVGKQDAEIPAVPAENT
ncbi:MAG: branched-chain amino acid ABC transporter permease [Chloroflexi bacterium]|nr:MAG: branched-chain amino acid ABC transporter permease [Chloroflexota bacterium]